MRVLFWKQNRLSPKLSKQNENHLYQIKAGYCIDDILRKFYNNPESYILIIPKIKAVSSSEIYFLEIKCLRFHITEKPYQYFALQS